MFVLPDLPYPDDGLEPVISGRTMKLHHDKHHAKYVETLNKLLAEKGEQPATLEEIVRRRNAPAKLRNNAGQAWNHAFFWRSMKPSGGQPRGELAAAIGTAFGGLEGLREAFVKEGTGHFASGWAWLVAEGGALKVISTHDGDSAIAQAGLTPLLTCDLWEHAYYLDYQNDRESFLERWFDALPDWAFAAAQWEAAQGRGAAFEYPKPQYG